MDRLTVVGEPGAGGQWRQQAEEAGTELSEWGLAGAEAENDCN